MPGACHMHVMSDVSWGDSQAFKLDEKICPIEQFAIMVCWIWTNTKSYQCCVHVQYHAVYWELYATLKRTYGKFFFPIDQFCVRVVFDLQEYDCLSVLSASHVRSTVVWGLMRNPIIRTCRCAKNFSFWTNLDPELGRIRTNAKTCKCHAHALSDLMYLEAWCDTHTIMGKNLNHVFQLQTFQSYLGGTINLSLNLKQLQLGKWLILGPESNCRTVEHAPEKFSRLDSKIKGNRGSQKFNWIQLHNLARWMLVAFVHAVVSEPSWNLVAHTAAILIWNLRKDPNEPNSSCMSMFCACVERAEEVWAKLRHPDIRTCVWENFRSELKEGHRGSRNFECTLMIAQVVVHAVTSKPPWNLIHAQTFKLGCGEKIFLALGIQREDSTRDQ